MIGGLHVRGILNSRLSTLAIQNLFLLLGSGLVALGCALASYRLLHGPQTYVQLAVGTLAWGAESKTGELAAAFVFILALPAAWLALQRASIRYCTSNGATATATLQFACMPGAVWLGHTVFAPSYGMGWLFLSVLLLAWWATGAVAANDCASGRCPGRTCAQSMRAIPFMLIPVLTGFSAVGALYFLNRALLMAYPFPAFLTGFCCAGAMILVILMTARRSNRFEELDWNRVLTLSQMGIPLLAAGLIPTPIAHGKVLEHATTISIPLAGLSVLVAGLVFWDILRCSRKKSYAGLLSAVSPLALFLCLSIIRSPYTDVPVVPTDDWHFGELLLPWIAWRDFDLIPFADLMPVRGFVSVVDAALSQVLMRGEAADLTHLRPAQGLIYSAIVFFPMRYAAGTLPALLAVAVLNFATPIGRIDYLFVAGVCVQAGLAIRRQFVAASMSWIFSSLALFLLAPGQGILYVIATIPLMFYAMCNMSRSSVLWLVGTAVGTVSALSIVVLTIPIFREISEGIGLYFADNISINAVASGIPWAQSFRPHAGETTLALEAFRSFCLVVAGLACVAGFNLYKQAPGGQASETGVSKAHARLNQIEIVLCAVVVLTVLTFLPRVLGRIDPSVSSRIGLLTLLVMGGLVPMIMARSGNLAIRGAVAVFAIFLASGLHVAPGVPHEGTATLDSAALQVPRQSNDATGIIDAADVGLKNIGSAKFDPAHLLELRQLRALLDEMLQINAPYYDFTNRNAHYVYFNRPVPAKWSSPYYLADERAQVRTANELAARHVSLLVLTASNVTHDGGTAALRAYWLYRFVLAEYVPFKRDGYIFAVRRDIADEPRFANFVQAGASRIDLFEEAFAVADLRQIPRAWEASANELREALNAEARPVQVVEIGNDRTSLDAHELAQGNGKDLLRFDLLRLRIACAARGGSMQLVWSAHNVDRTSSHSLTFTASSGTLLIPVGSRPAWILAAEVRDVVLEHGTTRCKVRQAEWLRRVKPEITRTATAGEIPQ